MDQGNVADQQSFTLTVTPEVLILTTAPPYTAAKRKIGHLVNFLIYSFYFISVHPLSGNGESELFVLQLQVVVDALQKAVDAG